MKKIYTSPEATEFLVLSKDIISVSIGVLEEGEGLSASWLD